MYLRRYLNLRHMRNVNYRFSVLLMHISEHIIRMIKIKGVKNTEVRL